MASVGSLSTSTSSSIRGYGGLASGLDRDELIKGMTIGTTTKITKQEQKKQKTEWMQEAVRAISDKMISFHGKYTETLTSSSNLFNSALWGRNKVTTSGDNSKYVTVSGTAKAADAMTIMGVKQRAQNASWSSTASVSSGKLTGEAFKGDTDNLAGKELRLKVGEGLYTVRLSAEPGKSLDNAQNIVDAVNNALAQETYEGDTSKKLSEFLEAKVEDGKFVLAAKKDSDGKTILQGSDDKPGSGDIQLLKGSTAAHYLGLDESADRIDLTDGITGEPQDLKRTFAEKISGKTLKFSYNGTEAEIKLPTEEQLQADGKSANEVIKESIQNQLNAAFGKDRIEVAINDNGGLTFTTKVPGATGTDAIDKSAIFTLSGGDAEAVDALGLRIGESTRLDMNNSIGTSGKIKINDIEISFDKDESIATLMTRIAEKTGLKISYMEASDKFTFSSNEKGASGAIKFDSGADYTTGNSVMNSIFKLGIGTAKPNENNTTGYEKRGQDAIVAIKYAGSDDIVEVRRDSNSFTVDGLTLSLKGTFGWDETNQTWKAQNDLTQAVEVNAQVDTDKLMSTIKSFVDEYNEIVDLVNSELTTKHEKDYDPLTSDQKSELSEDEIEKWEAKAKAGLLYGDSDLRSLSMDLRTVVSGGLLVKFEEIGISLSSTYSDNGKLSIDESKLRAALETNPEKVEDLFTSKAGVDAKGNETFNGLATNLKSVMDKYVKTLGSMETKGILIRKAGSKSAAQSLTQNTYYDQITSIDKIIEKLKARLKTEQDRYISQFSTLETLIANMNSQSSYLSSMGGY